VNAVHVSDSKTTAAAGTTAGTTATAGTTTSSSKQTTTGGTTAGAGANAGATTAGATAVNADAVITKMVHVHHFCVYWNGDEGGSPCSMRLSDMTVEEVCAIYMLYIIDILYSIVSITAEYSVVTTSEHCM
jgi:hypothetical protein